MGVSMWYCVAAVQQAVGCVLRMMMSGDKWELCHVDEMRFQAISWVQLERPQIVGMVHHRNTQGKATLL